MRKLFCPLANAVQSSTSFLLLKGEQDHCLRKLFCPLAKLVAWQSEVAWQFEVAWQCEAGLQKAAEGCSSHLLLQKKLTAAPDSSLIAL